MHDLRKKLLGMFEYLKKDVLDLHDFLRPAAMIPMRALP